MPPKKPTPFSSKRNKISKLILILLLFSSTILFSQPPGFDDDVNDEPAAPIDSGVLLLTIVGISLGVWYIKKNESVAITKK